MTIKDLIEKLQALSPDTLVLIDGYEGGYSDIGNPRIISVRLNVHEEDYYGPHDIDDKADVKALLLPRSPNPNSK